MLKANSQEITNEGKEFWLAFPEVLDDVRAGYWLNITSNTSSTGTVSIPGTSFSRAFSVTPGAIEKIRLNSVDAYIEGSDTIVDRAIHVTANNEIVVFAVTIHAARHEATLVLPKPGAWGKI